MDADKLDENLEELADSWDDDDDDEVNAIDEARKAVIDNQISAMLDMQDKKPVMSKLAGNTVQTRT